MTSGGTRPKRPAGEGVGGLLSGLGDLINLAERLAEQSEQGTTGEREFTSPGGLRGVYGFSVRTGAGGAPTVERFGNVRDTTQGPVVSDTREPLVDVFDEGEEVVVVAEIPGVQEKDIHLEVNGDVLALSATGPKRKYEKEILLPAAVDPGEQRRSYQNGYLELRFTKTQGEG
ncbi:MAG: archaeal heat shock protein Hsp20 [Streptosporangiaceae bacterium]